MWPAAPKLTNVPWFVAHIGVPALLGVALLSSTLGDSYAVAAAATLWAGMLFYALAFQLDRQPIWAWALAAVPPFALLVSLEALHVAPSWWGLAPALLALGYLGLALVLEPKARAYALPAYAGAAALAALALFFALLSPVTARWTLPLLLAGSLAITLAYHRGRFAWMAEPLRLDLATLGLSDRRRATAGLAAGAARSVGAERCPERAGAAAAGGALLRWRLELAGACPAIL